MEVEYKKLVWSYQNKELVESLENLGVDDKARFHGSDWGEGYILRTQTGYEFYADLSYDATPSPEFSYQDPYVMINELVSWK